MRIAIDGPAGSGKSTVAHALAKRCGFTYLDTGAMYRCVTLACLREKVDPSQSQEVTQVAERISIVFGVAEDGSQTVLLDGNDVTEEIRTPLVDAHVSAVSAIPAVREAMVSLQRKLGSDGDVVAEGRDIGTVVFPDAEVKVFLTADVDARARRRALQRNVTSAEETESILKDLRRRDEADSTRTTAPLTPAEDAYHMDSSSMTIDEGVAKIMELIDKAAANTRSGAAGEQGLPPQSTTNEGLTDNQANEGTMDKEAPKGKKRGAKIKPERSDKKADGGPMHVFGDNSLDDYYEHSIHEFPLTSRGLLAAAVGVCALASKTLWPWQLKYGERLWNAKGGQMIVMNHVSMLDPVIIVVSDWAHGRRVRPIYKSEFDKHEFVTWFFSRIGAIPVQRGKADVKAVRRAQRALQRGEDVLVFPEGTRIYSDDQEIELHGGFALIAQLAKAPVLPVAIVGARDGAPGGNKPLRPGRVWLEVGEPLTYDQIEEKGRKKQAKAMEKLAMDRVYALRDKLRAEHPGKM